MHQHHQFILTEHDGSEPRFRRLKGEDAEVERPLRNFRADLTCRNTPHVDVDQRMPMPESFDQRQHGVDRRLVASDQHAPPAEVAEIFDRFLGFL